MNLNNTYDRKLFVKCLQWACLLSATEATACLEAWERGDQWHGEAVNHFGGVDACMSAAYAKYWQLYVKAVNS